MVLPEPGKYATGMMFIEAREQDEVRTEFTKMATQMQLEVRYDAILLLYRNIYKS